MPKFIIPCKPKPSTFEKEERMLKAIATIEVEQFTTAEAIAEHFHVPSSTL